MIIQNIIQIHSFNPAQHATHLLIILPLIATKNPSHVFAFPHLCCAISKILKVLKEYMEWSHGECVCMLFKSGKASVQTLHEVELIPEPGHISWWNSWSPPAYTSHRLCFLSCFSLPAVDAYVQATLQPSSTSFDAVSNHIITTDDCCVLCWDFLTERTKDRAAFPKTQWSRLRYKSSTVHV